MKGNNSNLNVVSGLDKNTFFKTILTTYSNDNVRCFMVDGSEIRNPLTTPYCLDFTEGDNHMHNPEMVPPGEIWVDLDVAPTEVRCTILHELTERRFMIEKNMDYEDAHAEANKAEEHARKNRDKLDDLVLEELAIAPPVTDSPYSKEAPMSKDMKHTIRKTLPVSTPLVSDESRTIEFIASTETIDRDGEVIKASAWDLTNYLKNPVVQWAHRYDEPPVGKSPHIKVLNGKLTLPVEFPKEGDYEFADIIYRLAKGGFISAVSVGFIPKEWEKGRGEKEPQRTYTAVELLEVSIVPVPSNPDALVSAREAGVITVKQFETITNEPAPLDVQGFVRSHPKVVGQEEIKDEFDYCLSLIKGELSENNKSLLETMGTEIKRITGSDIPVSNKSYADIISALDDHHKSHNKVYKDCKDIISSIVTACNDTKEVEPIDMDLINSTIEKTIELWRKTNGT